MNEETRGVINEAIGGMARAILTSTRRVLRGDNVDSGDVLQCARAMAILAACLIADHAGAETEAGQIYDPLEGNARQAGRGAE